MTLNILHLFPELMSLYGEYANLAILRRHAEQLGVSVTIQTVSCEDSIEVSTADMIYMGAGTERSQKYALSLLRPHADALHRAAAQGTVLLFTGNAMETLGASITDAAGTRHEGLALASFTTTETEQRDPCDVIATPALWSAPVVGFMNKCSVTQGVSTPLFPSLMLGFGNESPGGAEGFVSGNLFATHLTGPVLVKNPAFTDHILTTLFACRGWPCPPTLPKLPHEQDAYAVTLRELTARIKTST